MFTLITPWYYEAHHARRNELLYCLNRNLEHPAITSLVLLVEGPISLPAIHEKVQGRYYGYRPTFADMVAVANEQNNIAILANTDIYFDDTLLLARHIKPNQCFALTRWDADQEHKLRFYKKAYSQDAWILKPPLRFTGGDYCTGKPGCDNRFARELADAGLQVSNPSKSIKACHLHLTQLRRYTRAETVAGPYLTIQPSLL